MLPLLLVALLFVQNLFGMDIQELSKDPPVRLWHHFITEQEAIHLINSAKPLLIRSPVMSPQGQSAIHPARTSSTAFLKKSQDPIIRSIEERIAQILNCSVDCIEPLQIVQYTYGQEYKPHFDYFPNEHLATELNNQRTETVLIYLNNVPIEAGGQTVFPRLYIGIIPVACNALYFKNLDDAGLGHEKTLHGGMPILDENHEKWACNVWIRQKPFRKESPHEPVDNHQPSTIEHF